MFVPLNAYEDDNTGKVYIFINDKSGFFRIEKNRIIRTRTSFFRKKRGKGYVSRLRASVLSIGSIIEIWKTTEEVLDKASAAIFEYDKNPPRSANPSDKKIRNESNKDNPSYFNLRMKTKMHWPESGKRM